MTTLGGEVAWAKFPQAWQHSRTQVVFGLAGASVSWKGGKLLHSFLNSALCAYNRRSCGVVSETR